MKTLLPLLLLPIWVLLNLIIMINGSESLRPVLTGPPMAYLSSRVAFRCLAPDAPPPVTYELVKDSGVPIDSGTDLQGDLPASFFLRVATTSGGFYHCRASTDDSAGVSNSIRLTVVIPPSETRVVSDPFPPVAFEGSRIVLSCNVSRGSHLSYSWFYNRKEMLPSASPLLRIQGNTLVNERVMPGDAGQYSCMAWSTVQDIKRFSSSTEVQLTVKVYISKPQISFSISKEDNGYLGNITCRVSRGSPPINFTFLLNNKEVGSVSASDALMAWFNVAMVPGLEMGKARCRAQTEVQDMLSEPLTLEVVPVGGDIKVQVEYFYKADYNTAAAKLSCHISRGTFPSISWLHNGSILSSEPSTDYYIPQVTPPFAFTDQGRTLILAKLGKEVFGSYRCKAKDSYDDTGHWMESEDVLVQVKGSLTPCLKHHPTQPTAAQTKMYTPVLEAIAIAFCCFVFLTLVISVACIYKMSGKRPDAQVNSDVRRMSVQPPHSKSRQDTVMKINAQNQIVEVTV